MISRELANALNDVLNANEQKDRVPLINGTAAFEIPARNYQELLQDYNDEEIATIMQNEKPRTWYELRSILINEKTAEEVRAHLLGYTSRKTMAEFIRRLRSKTRNFPDPETEKHWHDGITGGGGTSDD